jgi:hypothetical protein
MFDFEPSQLLSPGRYRTVVEARSIFCYWAVRDLGITATVLAKWLGLTQLALSVSVRRGEQIVKQKELELNSVLSNL